MSPVWEECDCRSFRLDYYRSIRYYGYALCGAAAVALIQVLCSVVYWVKRQDASVAVAPEPACPEAAASSPRVA